MLMLVAGLACPPAIQGQEPVFIDDFAGAVVDATRWQVFLPFTNTPPSTVRTTNGTLELFRRGVVEAIPAMPPALDIEGRVRFVGDADTLSVVFRSDLTVTNQAERRGVQAALQQGTGRVFLIPEPFVVTPIVGAYPIGRDTNVAFRVTDNGEIVRLYLQDFFQPILTATITNRRGSRLAVYNLNGTTSRARVDDLRVHALQTSIFLDDALVRTGVVRRSTPARVRLQSVFTNGSVFYTLDGSVPSFVSAEYNAPLMLSNSATIRAVAYRGDFLASSHSSAIEFQYLPQVRLTNETPGGGLVSLDPPGPYLSNQVVTLTAMPAPGWQFLRWSGAARGTSASTQITLTNHLAFRAVFGTVLTVSAIGSGQIQVVAPGPVHDYGAVTRLLARPDLGHYFVRWANALTGSVSPVTFTVTNAGPGVSALFAPLNAGQVGLTVLLEGTGTGTVAVSPALNVFGSGQTVTLTAVPDPDQVWLGWAGASGGSVNPLNLLMNESKTVSARFAPGVRFDPAALRLESGGFHLSIQGMPGFVFDLEQSTNLATWTPVATITNVTGRVEYRHSTAAQPAGAFYRVVAP